MIELREIEKKIDRMPSVRELVALAIVVDALLIVALIWMFD